MENRTVPKRTRPKSDRTCAQPYLLHLRDLMAQLGIGRHRALALAKEYGCKRGVRYVVLRSDLAEFLVQRVEESGAR